MNGPSITFRLKRAIASLSSFISYYHRNDVLLANILSFTLPNFQAWAKRLEVLCPDWVKLHNISDFCGGKSFSVSPSTTWKEIPRLTVKGPLLICDTLLSKDHPLLAKRLRRKGWRKIPIGDKFLLVGLRRVRSVTMREAGPDVWDQVSEDSKPKSIDYWGNTMVVSTNSENLLRNKASDVGLIFYLFGLGTWGWKMPPLHDEWKVVVAFTNSEESQQRAAKCLKKMGFASLGPFKNYNSGRNCIFHWKELKEKEEL